MYGPPVSVKRDVEQGEPAKRFFGDRRRVVLGELMELPSRMNETMQARAP